MILRLIAPCFAILLSGCAASSLSAGPQQLAGQLAVLALDVATDEQCRAKAVPGRLDTDPLCEMQSDAWIRNAKTSYDRRRNRDRREAVQVAFDRFMQDEGSQRPRNE